VRYLRRTSVCGELHSPMPLPRKGRVGLHIPFDAPEMKMHCCLRDELGVQVIGGVLFVATTTSPYRALAELAGSSLPKHAGEAAGTETQPPGPCERTCSVLDYGISPSQQDKFSSCHIGERSTPSVPRKVREPASSEDWDGLGCLARGR